MTKKQLVEEIIALLVKFQKALQELEEQGNGCVDIKFPQKILDISKEFEDKLRHLHLK